MRVLFLFFISLYASSDSFVSHGNDANEQLKRQNTKSFQKLLFFHCFWSVMLNLIEITLAKKVIHLNRATLSLNGEKYLKPIYHLLTKYQNCIAKIYRNEFVSLKIQNCWTFSNWEKRKKPVTLVVLIHDGFSIYIDR